MTAADEAGQPVPSAGRPPRALWLDALLLDVGVGLILVAAALIQAAGWPVFWPVIGATVLGLAYVFARLWRQPATVVTALVIWFSTSALFVALLAPLLDAQVTAWLQYFKEMMYLALFAVLTFSYLRDRWRAPQRWWPTTTAPDWLAILVIGIVGVYFLIALATARQDLVGEIVYARRFASLPILFLAGRLLLADRQQLGSVIGYLVVVALVVAAFGLIERLILGDRFWTDVVRIDIYHQHIVDQGFGSSRSVLRDGLPSDWHARLQGLEFRRLVSSFLEPTTLGIFLGLATVLGIAEALRARVGWVSWRWAVVGVLGVALLLTLGKGGALVVVITLLTLALRASAHNRVRLVLWGAGLVVVLLLIGQLLPVANNLNRHLGGLMTGVGQLLTHPLGTGLGSTGYWGEIRRIGNDSTVGAVAAQVGVAGAIAYVAWLVMIFLRLLPSFSSTTDPYSRVMAGAILGLFAVAFVSNSASGLTGSAFYLLLAGWLLAIRQSEATRAPA